MGGWSFHSRALALRCLFFLTPAFVNIVALFVCLHLSCFIKSLTAVTRPLRSLPKDRAGFLSSSQVPSVVGLARIFSPQAASSKGILYSHSPQRRSMRDHSQDRSKVGVGVTGCPLMLPESVMKDPGGPGGPGTPSPREKKSRIQSC